jgi:hypothetical protein
MYRRRNVPGIVTPRAEFFLGTRIRSSSFPGGPITCREPRESEECARRHVSDANDLRPVHFGQPVDGHFAFIGRVLDRVQSAFRELTKPFEYWLGAGTHPTTNATFGKHISLVDIHFFAAGIPQAQTNPP